MLKSYVVIMKSVEISKKDKMVKYMLNEEHKNHISTKIFSNNNLNEEEYINRLIDKIYLSQANYAKNKKGGRPLKNIAKSLTFNIPKYFKCSEEDLEIIEQNMKYKILDLLAQFNISLNESDLFSASHYQDNKHIHLLLPMVDLKGKNIRHFKRKAFLLELKMLFTETVDKQLNTDIKQVKTLSKDEQNNNSTINQLQALIKDYEHILSTERDLMPLVSKHINTSILQANRLLNNSDNILINSVNNLNKRINDLNNHESNKIENIRTIKI